MNYILFDDPSHEQLLPLTFTRPVCDIRIGIMTIREKWEKALDCTTSTSTVGYLPENSRWKLNLHALASRECVFLIASGDMRQDAATRAHSRDASEC